MDQNNQNDGGEFPNDMNFDIDVENLEDRPGDKTTCDYFINDFKINELPDDNPLQNVISEFIAKK